MMRNSITSFLTLMYCFQTAKSSSRRAKAFVCSLAKHPSNLFVSNVNVLRYNLGILLCTRTYCINIPSHLKTTSHIWYEPDADSPSIAYSTLKGINSGGLGKTHNRETLNFTSGRISLVECIDHISTIIVDRGKIYLYIRNLLQFSPVQN